MSFLYLATEDVLSETVGLKIIRDQLGDQISVHTLRQNGSGYLRKKIDSFVNMATRNSVVLLTDLDSVICAPSMKAQWLEGFVQPEKFIFRIAVRETESWILADRRHFSDFLGVSEKLIPPNPEVLPDPKAKLVDLARKGRREIKSELVPKRGVRAKQGLGYNDVLCSFVEKTWDCRRASTNSDSLRRACERIASATQLK